eukprot:12356995-Heterocapsa_arctica.AAC.1
MRQYHTARTGLDGKRAPDKGQASRQTEVPLHRATHSRERGPCPRRDHVVDDTGRHGGTHAATPAGHGRSGDDGVIAMPR